MPQVRPRASAAPVPSAYLDTAAGTFASLGLGLDTRLLKAVARLGFVYPTLVQAQAIPLGLAGRDLLVRARTGSGKTAAYGLVLLQKLLEIKASREAGADAAAARVFALVLVPTRELVEQTATALTELAYYATDVVRVVGLGGGSLAEQAAALGRGADVVVGTPARVLAHLTAGSLNAESLRTSVSVLVVDEADLVLSYGGGADIKAVVAALPRITHTLLVSATLSTKLDDLRRLVLHNPAILRLEDADGAAGGGGGGTLSQYYVRVPAGDRFLLLFALLKLRLLAGRTLVFAGSLDTALRIRLVLERFSVPAAVLNAELPANSRRHIVAQFNRGVFDLLIATDEAIARSEAPAAGGGASDAAEIAGGGGGGGGGGGAGSGSGAVGVAAAADEDDDEEEEDPEAAAAAAKAKQLQLQRKRRRGGSRGGGVSLASDPEYGVSRGVDFRGVTTVVNFDFPPDATTYTHRVGRTARGGASGVALSFVAPEGVAPAQDALLGALLAPPPAAAAAAVAGVTAAAAAADAPRLPGQGLVPLPFDAREVEGFRYRVDDVIRSVNPAAVRAARLAEVRREVLASDALRGHFEDNPRDLAVLQQADKPLAPAAVMPHLKNVPAYLLPPTLRAAIEAAGAGARGGDGGGGKKQKKQRRGGGGGAKDGAAAAAPSSGGGGGGGDGGGEVAGRRPPQQTSADLVSRAASEVYRPRQNRVDPLRALAYQAASSASAMAAAGVGQPRRSGGSGKRR